MSVINRLTGYRGYTVSGMGNSYGIDANGRVKNCIVSIRFPSHRCEVDINITKGNTDWAAKMGDGSIIPLSNPVILYQNMDSAIVLFDMANPYPSNSPLFLVIRSDTAGISFTETNRSRSYVNNMASGIFAMTTERNSDSFANGYVNKLIATLQFPYQVASIDFKISSGVNDWKAKMGDGSIVSLSNPTVLAVNEDSAVVQFKMGTSYPSNSPCILLYGSSTAYYEATAVNKRSEFVAVSDVYGIPTVACVTDEIDLGMANILPYNASNTNIVWTVVSGSGSINGSKLTVTGTGNIVIKATIANGISSGNPFTKNFTISASRNTISITMDILSELTIDDEYTLMCSGLSSHGYKLSYQWYHNTTNSRSGATAIAGATDERYTIPSNTSPGVHYYFCKISSTGGASDVYTRISKITFEVKLLGISISPNGVNINEGTSTKLNIVPNPSNATPNIIWKSSNINICTVSSNGTLTGVNQGSATITAKTADGKFSATISVSVISYIPVSKVTLQDYVPNETNTVLTPTVYPENANAKTCTFTMASDTAGTTLTGNTVRCTGTGYFIVRCTIKDGLFPGSDFSQDIKVIVNKRFIPVTSINLSNDLDQVYEVGDHIELNGSVYPANATVNIIKWSKVSGNCSVNDGVITVTGVGNIRVRGTVTNGGGTESSRVNFTQDFIFTNITNRFVPVSNVEVSFDHTSVGGEKYNNPYLYMEADIFKDSFDLPIAVYPNDATNKDYRVTLKKKEYGYITGALSTTTVVSDITKWELDSSNAITFTGSKNLNLNLDELKNSVMYKVLVAITVINGNSRTEDYTQDVEFYVLTFTHEPFYPLKNLEVIFPSRLRCYYPILVTKYSVTPKNATGVTNGRYNSQQIGWKAAPEMSDEDRMTFNTSFSGTSDVHLETIELPSIIQWGLSEYYIEPVNPGLMSLSIMVYDSTVEDLENYNPYNPDLAMYLKAYHDIEILDPFIRVKDILNIPESIKKNKSYVLSPEISTGKGTDCYNPYWDEEIPSYSEIVWSITNNTAGATLNNGVLKCTKAGSVTLKATIENGEDEDLIWYDISASDTFLNNYRTAKKDKFGRRWDETIKKYDNCIPVNVRTEANPFYVRRNVAADYEKEFTITVTNSAPVTTELPFLKVTLKNNSVIEVFDFEDLEWFCNDQPDTFNITIGTKTFKKSDITEFEFYDTTKVVEEPEKNRSWLVGLEIEGPDTYGYGNVASGSTKPDMSVGDFYINTNTGNIFECTAIGTTEDTYTWIESICTLIPGFTPSVSTELTIIIGTAITGTATTGTIFSSSGISNAAVNDIYLNSVDLGVYQCITAGNPSTAKWKYCNSLTYLGIEKQEPISDEEYYEKYQEYIAHENMKNAMSENLTSLHNFGWNCTSLTAFNKTTKIIPESVTGESCLENFLRGCISFNQNLIIKEGCTGNKALKYFLRGATKFNSVITLPAGLTGDSVLHGFLYGCIIYNQTIVIPNSVEGTSCLERFLYGCSKFNKKIIIPSTVNGYACMRDFLTECTSFNQNITLPDNVSSYGGVKNVDDSADGRELGNMMRNCHAMCSTITVPELTGKNAQVSPLSFTSTRKASKIYTTGITITGTGATEFLKKVMNSYKTTWPYAHFTNLD